MRRTRWTVTHRVLGVERRTVILAYTAKGAAGCFREVVKVERGDYRRARRASAPDGGWEFNMPAIHAAFEAMTGEKLPAMLKFEKGRRGAHRRGVFAWESIAGNLTRLTVRVRRDVEPVQANRTLWHELAHVAQFVRCPDFETWATGEQAERAARHGYRNRPSEIEAREWECLAEVENLLTIRG